MGDITAPTIKLYRAVLGPELASIVASNGFSNIVGVERKYFATTQRGAKRFATMAPEWLDVLDYVDVDGGIESVTIPTHLLNKLSSPKIVRDR